MFMVATGILNTAMISVIKQLSDDLHPFEIGFFRCLVGLFVLMPLLWRGGGIRVLRTNRLGLHALRGALNAAGMLAFFVALGLTPLATVSALSFTAPLFATLLAMLILGETVGLRRASGLLVGFLGTIIILRPGMEGMDFGALLAVGSSVAWAGAMITIKQLTRTESVLSITAWAAISVGLFALIPAILVWQWPTGEQWLLLILVGVLGSAMQYCIAAAFSLADTTVVLPFDFLKLTWASLAGFLLFAEVPDLWTWIGGTVIFASTIYIAHRERKQGKSPMPLD